MAAITKSRLGVIAGAVAALLAIILGFTMFSSPSRAESQEEFVSYIRSLPPLGPSSRIADMSHGELVDMGVRLCRGMRQEGYESFSDAFAANQSSFRVLSRLDDPDEFVDQVDALCTATSS